MLDRDFAAIGGNGSDRGGAFQRDVPRQRGKGIGQRGGLCGQARQVAGAGVDRAPRLDLAQHRGRIHRVNQRALDWGKLLHLKPSLAERAALSNPAPGNPIAFSSQLRHNDGVPPRIDDVPSHGAECGVVQFCARTNDGSG